MTDSTIPAMNPASALSGTEPFASVQSGADVRVSAQQVADFVSSAMIAVRLIGVDFNVANSDHQIVIPLPTGVTHYQVSGVFLSKASHSLSAATAGLFTQAAGAGVAIVTAASAITVTATAADTNNNSQSMTVNNGATEAYTETTLYFRVAAAEGAVATADVILHIRPLS